MFVDHRITECFGLEGTFRCYLAQPPCSEQGHLQLDQVAQSPVHPMYILKKKTKQNQKPKNNNKTTTNKPNWHSGRFSLQTNCSSCVFIKKIVAKPSILGSTTVF